MQTRTAAIGSLASGIIAILVSGCGGNSMPPAPTPMSVTATVTGSTPSALAIQLGTGAFASMTPANSITFPLPSGTTSYAIAWVCPKVTGRVQIIQATTQDTTSPRIDCVNPPLPIPTVGNATGSLSSTLPGVASFEILAGVGILAQSGPLSSGPFSVSLPVGTEDVAALALDSSNNIVGIKILRSQTVPGALNGGNGIVLSDATIPQTVTVNNVPAGFNGPGVIVQYQTANGTGLLLNNPATGNPRTYAALPAAETQPGDFYVYQAGAAAIPFLESVNTVQETTSGGGAVTLTLPAPWTFNGPTPAKLPAFTFNYSGFAGQPFINSSALIGWQAASGTVSISVEATANSLNGTSTLTFPDLSALPGFFGPAPSGTTIFWRADIQGGTTPPFTSSSASNISFGSVFNSGQYTQP
jgi:hypothetical protein